MSHTYSIGIAQPTSLMVNTYGTGTISDVRLEKIMSDVFDWRPSMIIKSLDLLRPIYRKTASYGHFGRKDMQFPWENCNLVEQLQASI
jgi:S-adenosylmethionine synthetase